MVLMTKPFLGFLIQRTKAGTGEAAQRHSAATGSGKSNEEFPQDSFTLCDAP
jgi:hypothetical protein